MLVGQTINSFDDCHTGLVSPSITYTAGDVARGVYLMLFKKPTASGNLTVQLYENAVAVATTLATFNAASIDTTSSIAYYAFANNYTLLAGKTYTVKVTAATSAVVYWRRNATAGNYALVFDTNADDTTGITAGDTLIIANGVTLEADTSFTMSAWNGTTGQPVLTAWLWVMAVPLNYLCLMLIKVKFHFLMLIID